MSFSNSPRETNHEENSLADLQRASELAARSKEQLAGAVGITEFEMKKQPNNTFLTTLRERFMREWQIL